jgi:hypothetical protein
MNASRATYLDSSALAKLVVREPESPALAAYLRRRRVRVSSAIARTEVLRAVDAEDSDQLRRARDVLANVGLVRITDRVLDAAGRMQPSELRSLDAIHLATAEQLEDELGAFVTYDERLADAAAAHGFRVAQPR